jgi:rsbT co-antagonist protein RsbR
MEIEDFAARLARMERVLERVANGDFDQRMELDGAMDELSGLEMGINFMILDLRAMAEANREQERKLRAQAEDLEAKLARIEAQEEAIRELTIPVIEVWDDVLVLPIVGFLDSRRSQELMENMLASVSGAQAKSLIIDLTGVELVDTGTAGHLLKMVHAARLLGAECVLTGLHPAVARTLTELGADLGQVATLRNLKAGLRHCLAKDRAASAHAPAGSDRRKA